MQVIIEAGVIPYLVGPAETGKSTACEQVARAMGLNFYFANRVQNSYDLIGYKNAAGVFESVQFFETYTKGGVFIIPDHKPENEQA